MKDIVKDEDLEKLLELTIEEIVKKKNKATELEETEDVFVSTFDPTDVVLESDDIQEETTQEDDKDLEESVGNVSANKIKGTGAEYNSPDNHSYESGNKSDIYNTGKNNSLYSSGGKNNSGIKNAADTGRDFSSPIPSHLEHNMEKTGMIGSSGNSSLSEESIYNTKDANQNNFNETEKNSNVEYQARR